MATPQGIAVIAPLKAGQDEACRKVLEGINSGREDTVTIDFARENRTHFARYVIIEDPDKGEGRKRLLFSAIFDGTADIFFRDMANNTSDIDVIWNHCEGYSGKANFVQFMLQHNNPTGTFLKGFRFESVGNIQKYLKLRDDLREKFAVTPAEAQQLLSTLPKKPAWQAWLTDITRKVSEFLYKVWVTITVVPDLIGLLRHGWHIVEAKRLIDTPVALDRDFSFAPLDKSGPCYPLDPGDEVVKEKASVDLPSFLNREMVQNQMTIITANVPQTLKRQEAILAYIGTLAKIPFINRNSAIPTIHFGRWMMIDGGKRMLFLSNYDGGWENYIGDFVDKAANGLDAFWGGSLGWREAATLDIELFKEGIRCHQTRASFFYSAYPTATVVNIDRARTISRGYHNNVDEESAKTWLKNL